MAGELWARDKLSKLSDFSGMEQFINLRILDLSVAFQYICQGRRIEHILFNNLIYYFKIFRHMAYGLLSGLLGPQI